MIEEQDVVKNDFYLKFTSEAAMATALSAFYDEEGEFVGNTADYAIDVVGVLQEPTGATLTDDEGMGHPEMVALDGWHVNIRLIGNNSRADVEALAAYTVKPSPATPSRVWL